MYLESDPFRIKMSFLLPAVLFHFTLYRKMRRTEGHSNPLWGKLAAVVASGLWLGVGIAGRWIGFY